MVRVGAVEEDGEAWTARRGGKKAQSPRTDGTGGQGCGRRGPLRQREVRVWEGPARTAPHPRRSTRPWGPPFRSPRAGTERTAESAGGARPGSRGRPPGAALRGAARVRTSLAITATHTAILGGLRPRHVTPPPVTQPPEPRPRITGLVRTRPSRHATDPRPNPSVTRLALAPPLLSLSPPGPRPSGHAVDPGPAPPPCRKGRQSLPDADRVLLLPARLLWRRLPR